MGIDIVENYLKKLSSTVRDNLQDTKIITIGKGKITFTNSEETHIYHSNRIYTIDRSEKLIIIYLKDGVIFILPKRIFTSNTDYEKFYLEVNSIIGEERKLDHSIIGQIIIK
jgi:hypothetical protein